MIDRIPYTYCIKHLPTGKCYYGSRFAKGCSPKDLWVKYFTSSPIIKDLIKQDGKDSFITEVRKVFDCPIKCQHYENKVLRRLKIPYNQNWFNRHYGHVYHYECQSKGGRSLAQKRIIDPKLDEYLKNSSRKGATISALKKKEIDYKIKRSLAGKIGGKHHNRAKSKEIIIEQGKRTKGTKWMFNPLTNKYHRIPSDLVKNYITLGWIIKFKEPWNKNTGQNG